MTSSSGHVIALDQSGASIWAKRAHFNTEEAKVHHSYIIQLPPHVPLSGLPEHVPQASSYQIVRGHSKCKPGQVH